MARFNDKELASDFLKSLVGLPDDVRKDAVLSLINMVVNGKDIPDDELNSWIDLYPEENREGLKGHFIYGNISSDDDKKNQPPADIKDDDVVAEQLADNAEKLNSDLAEEDAAEDDDDEYINSLIADLENDLGAEDEPADDEPDDEPADDKLADEPAKDEPDTGSEEQDETTRNILAGLSDK